MSDEKIKEKVNEIHKMIDRYKDISQINDIYNFLKEDINNSLYNDVKEHFETVYIHNLANLTVLDFFVLEVKRFWKLLKDGLKSESKYIDSWTQLTYKNNDLDIEIYERESIFNPIEIAFWIFQIWTGNVKEPEDE